MYKAILYCTLFIFFSSCGQDNNPFIGKWEIKKSEYSGKRGSNNIEIISKNDSLFYVFKANREPVYLKQEGDTLFFIEAVGKLFFVQKDRLKIVFGRAHFQYYKEGDKANTENEPEFVGKQFITAIYNKDLENAEKYSIPEKHSKIRTSIAYLKEMDDNFTVDPIYTKSIEEIDNITYYLFSFQIISSKNLPSKESLKIGTKLIDDEWKVVDFNF